MYRHASLIGGILARSCWTYLPGSDLKESLAYPNGDVVRWEYEPRRDLVTLVSNGVHSSFRYAYDAAGRRVSKNDKCYRYNPRGELILALSFQGELRRCMMKKNNKAHWVYGIGLAGLLVLSGCAELAAVGVVWHGGVSRIRDGGKGGYATGQVYELVHPLFIMSDKREIGRRRGTLAAPEELRPKLPAMRSAPPTVESWRNGQGRTKWDADVVTNEYGYGSFVLGVLEKGERIVVVGREIKYALSVWFGYGSVDDILADVVGGDHDGWRVGLRDISFWGDELWPDARFIRRRPECEVEDRTFLDILMFWR